MNRGYIGANDDAAAAVIRVLVLGPFPGTSGGIGTMMTHLSGTESKRSRLTFLDPGSTGKWRGWSFIRAIAWILAQRGTYDAAHINLSSRGSCYRKIILSWALRVTRKPYLVHLHGSEFREFYDKSSKSVQVLCRKMMTQAARVLVLGHDWKQFVVRTLECDQEVSVILPNAVPGPAALPNRSGLESNILFTGRLGKRKGVPELLDAVRGMPAKPSWSLTLAGDVVDDELLAMLRDVPPAVKTVGWLSQIELQDVLKASSIFVLPSHAEGLPLSLLDAMAWGLAPIVTDVGSISDVVTDGENAVLVEVGNPTSIRAALLTLISDPALTKRIGTAARLKWESGYSMTAYRDRLDDVYEACLKG